MSDTRRLRIDPEIQAFHARVTAAIAALEVAATDEERDTRRAVLELLKAECIETITRRQDAFRASLGGF